jgi:hypothetical protein
VDEQVLETDRADLQAGGGRLCEQCRVEVAEDRVPPSRSSASTVKLAVNSSTVAAGPTIEAPRPRSASTGDWVTRRPWSRITTSSSIALTSLTRWVESTIVRGISA